MNFNATIGTDRSFYNTGQPISVQGTLDLNGTPVTNALIALEIDAGPYPVAYRTLNSGSDPVGPYPLELLDVFISLQNGTRVTNAKNDGTTLYCVWAGYKNIMNYSIWSTIVFTIFDSTNSPVVVGTILNQAVSPNTAVYTGVSTVIPETAALGYARIYASAFSAYPRLGGRAHSPEKESTFNIVTSKGPSSLRTNSIVTFQMPGSYNTSFSIGNFGSRLGNYSATVIPFRLPYQTSASTTFQVEIPGDLNKDGIVDILDVVIVAGSFNAKAGDSNYRQIADPNGDGIVDILDVVFVTGHFEMWGFYS